MTCVSVVAAVATFLGSVPTARGQQAERNAQMAYFDCMNSEPGARQSIADLASQGTLNRQVIALIVVNAEEACATQQTTWLSFYPPDERGYMNSVSHQFFIDTLCKRFGAC